MKALLLNRLTLVWMVLCTGTLVSQLLGGGTAAFGVTILVIAFAKAHLVLHYFMGLSHAPMSWRQSFGAWVVLVAALLIILY